MKRFLIPLLLVLTLALAACSAASPVSDQSSSEPTGQAQNTPAAQTNSLTRSDQQGAVAVNVTPLNLDNPADQLEFDISLETHSVDLSMDLATLATLTTDTGLTIQATKWDAPRGGHHVEGQLLFPALQDGKSILDGASKLMLTITNVDAASRTFEWDLK